MEIISDNFIIKAHFQLVALIQKSACREASSCTLNFIHFFTERILIYYIFQIALNYKIHNNKIQLIKSFNTIIKGKMNFEIINYYNNY